MSVDKVARPLADRLYEGADRLYEGIAELDDKALDALILECSRFNKINCSWIAYRLRDAMIAFARNVQQVRHHDKEA